MSPILHLPKYPSAPGGMGYLLKLHHQQGAPVHNLIRKELFSYTGLREQVPFGWQKKALKKLENATRTADRSVYYNCWGVDLFSKYDRAPVKIGYLHNHFPNFERYVQHFANYLDGFICVNSATEKAVKKLIRNRIPQSNVTTVRLPISPPERNTWAQEKEPIVGLVGRINYSQKRYDRLPDFAWKLRDALPNLRVEILGSGEKESEVKRNVTDIGNCFFRDWVTGHDYWATIARWKYVLFLSDYEGLPISLLEAIQAGCHPVYPDFHMGDNQGLPLHLYPTGNLTAAINVIAKLESDPLKKPVFEPQNTADYLTEFDQLARSISATSRAPKPFTQSSFKRYNQHYRELIHEEKQKGVKRKKARHKDIGNR